MEKDIKLLLVPDVHGRDFWRKPVIDNIDKPIVFLGDYLDPYRHEGITIERAIDVFTEIVNLKKEHNNITLLLGNHDCSYTLRTDICECRHSWSYHTEIAKIFEENFEHFDLAKECKSGGKRFLISHAGIHKQWITYNRYAFPEGFNPTAKALNTMLHSEDKIKDLSYALRDLSFYRGGYDGYGSIVWADMREFVGRKEETKSKTYQIVGHTMLKQAVCVLKEKMYFIDCQKVFYLDNHGEVRYYDNDEKVFKY